jgi:hypothetical protein
MCAVRQQESLRLNVLAREKELREVLGATDALQRDNAGLQTQLTALEVDVQAVRTDAQQLRSHLEAAELAQVSGV